jgi:hypothetical protein
MSRRRNRRRLTHFAGLLLVGRHDFRMPASTGFLTSLATNRSAPFAAETGFIAGAVARYQDNNPLTWVLVVLLVLIVAFICWPPPPGDVDTGPGCNGP